MCTAGKVKHANTILPTFKNTAHSGKAKHVLCVGKVTMSYIPVQRVLY